jgi:serine/threonine protein kinase
VTDYMKGSDLLNVMNVRGHSFTELETKRVMTRLLMAVRHIHAAGVMHRDIKLENVLIDNCEDVTSVKLADFGFAAICDPSSAPSLKDVYGTPQYVAPEIILAHSPMYGNKADMWSLGVLLFIMLTGMSPFSSKRFDDRSRVPFGDPKCKHLSDGAKDLIRRLLKVDPAARLSAKDALAHPWLYI